MAFIAGAYTVTLGGSSVGQLAQGVTIEHSFSRHLITGDNFADSAQDGIFRGGNVFAAYNLLEYNAAGALSAFWPFGSAFLTMDTVIGTLDSANDAQIVMTAVAGTPAASTPASVTMPSAILAEGYSVGLLFAPELRVVPIRQRIYPNGSGVYGTLT